MAFEWSDDLKAQVIKDYEEANPTPETSTEIINSIVEGLEDDATVNGVRMILVRAEVYVKKDATKAAKGDKPASTRVNKADAIAALEELIESNELEVDDSITGKLTGKAAVYFTTLFKALTAKED